MTSKSVFADQSAKLFATYRVKIQFRGRLVGGIPKDPGIIDAWIRTSGGVDSVEERRQMLLRTLQELGADVNEEMTYDALVEASKALAVNQGTGFKQDEDGLYIEDRQVKAMLKENTNVLYAGERWGKTRKGPKSYLAERVFVNPSRIHLGRMQPDGADIFIGHVSGPQGPQSILQHFEYVEGAEIEFEVMAANDAIAPEHWPEIWLLAQENGLGAKRSQSYGRFDVIEFEKVK